jgi:hypothetical protein
MAAAQKLDLKKELKQLYRPSENRISIVDVPPIGFLMVDGRGDPNNSKAYVDAVTALYAVAYTLKFTLKAAGKTPDFTVMPLEGLWWADDMKDFTAGNRDNWQWTMMIAVPDFVTESDVAAAKVAAEAKKDAPSVEALRFERFHEGPAAQILYVGPYAEEGPTIAAIHGFIAEQGHNRSGRHHEIYLSDPRRTDPKKLKTIIRQPFK